MPRRPCGGPENSGRRQFVIRAASMATASKVGAAAAASKPDKPVRVTDFGADPTGGKNSTTAFQAAAAAINAARGGTLVIAAGTYIVGAQRFAAAPHKGYAYQAEPILSIAQCTSPVVIEGNGAILKLANGLKFGSFDPVTGARYDPPSLPFTKSDYSAPACRGGMVELSGNKGPVTVRNLELDGNISNLLLGGVFGDKGRQLPASAIWVYGNSKVEIVNVHTHHHALDGIMIGYRGLTAASPEYPHTLLGVVSEYNARQGLSWVGGTRFTAKKCKFNHTGKAVFASAPGAGVDIEAEDSVCRNGTFEDCEFADNTGVGMVAESGDGADVSFRNCTFWGVTSWAIWPRKPGIAFHNCKIIGPSVNPYASPDAAKATQFLGCLFTDEQLYRGAIYGKGKPSSMLINMTSAQNVLFDSCRVVARYQKLGNIGGATIRNCTFEQKTGAELLPDKDWTLILRGCTLESDRFIDAIAQPPAHAYYISVTGDAIESGVEVVSPRGKWKWGNWSWGGTGMISKSGSSPSGAAAK